MSLHPKTIFVTGDIVVDHHLYAGKRQSPDAKSKTGTRSVKAKGGAGLLHQILKSVIKKRSNGNDARNLYAVEFGFRETVYRKLPASMNGYAFWKPFDLDKDGKKVWRMAQPLGYGGGGDEPFDYTRHAAEIKETPSVVVIDDGGLGFRNNTQRNAWPKAILQPETSAPEWIVLKMSSPVGQGDLWRHLSSQFADRLVVVASIGDIRKEEVKVSRGVSWERTALDLAEELCFNSEIRPLLNCKHLIVHFGTEGALHVEKTAEGRIFNLVYDPEHLEREWSAEGQGQGMGYMACLTAGIADRLLLPDHPNPVADGIRAGLSAMRTMHRSGHGSADGAKPGFPFNDVAGDILHPKFGYPEIRLPNPETTTATFRKSWTIMTAVLEGVHKNPRPLFGIGRRAAMLGPKALAQIPRARFGKLYTVDRNEIESLRNIRNLILGYERNDKGEKPLNLAVFGPPGAGKSYGIKQIAKGILGDKVPILEFNLSQFKNPDDLTGAFHQVRDKALGGITPVVFWDEFDSGEYEWLQYLLAPMQDGAFIEGQISHPIGKSVFVFAGGTSFDMENFGPKETDEAGCRTFKLKKGPDFKSRLSGYLNVLGPNRRQAFDAAKNAWLDDPKDICYPVRRAILMRGMLGIKDGDKLDIDHGILSALIETKRFKHGARSLEKIVQQLKKPGVTSIRRSDLPSEDILSLHADPEDYMALVNRDLKFKTHAEDLAPFVHRFYRELGIKEGWIKPEMNKDYNDLNPDYKEDNRAAASRIPNVLDLVGLYVVPEDFPETQPETEIAEIIEANIELLAEAEHNDWMAFKLENGWHYGTERNDDKKIHPCMRPYHELSEQEKNKDRNAVRHYSDILKEAKYKIVAKLV